MRNIDVVNSWYYGNVGSTKHLFTDGRTIWSYGRHFPIAFRALSGQIYFNSDTYSTTTSCHQGHVARVLGFSTRKELVKAVKKSLSNIILLDTEKMQGIVNIGIA